LNIFGAVWLPFFFQYTMFMLMFCLQQMMMMMMMVISVHSSIHILDRQFNSNVYILKSL